MTDVYIFEHFTRENGLLFIRKYCEKFALRISQDWKTENILKKENYSIYKIILFTNF